ncbi:type I polyketide synthase [Mycobacteroides sp. LB1]|uniref:sulfolipid-1 biosynthesis phthioceranic/hydroxyphthioceranic acid synthase n=1 Tax=Mycobacteroides sp. LB1 TaxID=2750814 RepID=UPI0015DD6533|nr:type I polyketide synthase [Mycobacteroides sp. LB1]
MTDASATPVAVIGMGCRLPGGIESPEQFWQALLRGEDFITEVPPDRWDLSEYYDPESGVPGKSPSKWGAFLDDVGGFDADFFSINEREATSIDPQHRVLLETSWQAVEHAGMNPRSLAGSQTAVFVGVTHNDYQLLAADAGDLGATYGFAGTNLSMASGRISYALGVHGPSYAVDAGCASGLLTVHMASQSLASGESDLALAGGVNLVLEPRRYVGASQQRMLSPTGRCHTFDEQADGFVMSEGCVVLLLKRLPDAVRDGDRILAVVRGSASNQDGRTVNQSTPSSEAQTAACRAALAVAGVDADTIGMVEAHGTGTPVGDPIEFKGLAQVYGVGSPCAVGSAKTNFGHTMSAAGALGLMKAVLAVQHGEVPPNLHFTGIPGKLADVETNLFVPQEVTLWPGQAGVPRRAAVSSYGMSGSNVHAIVEQAPLADASSVVADSPLGEQLLFPLSSTSVDELRRTAGQLADWVAERPDISLNDVAYTLARRRAHRSVRTAVVADGIEELLEGLREVAGGDAPHQPAVAQDDRGPVWMFSGQGSQWAGMGAELLTKEPVFAATIARLEPLIAGESGFSVTEAISAPETVTGIDRVQPTLFAMQVSLAAAVTSYGITPGAVIGHSMGEVAAAVVSGALSLEDGVRVICRRSRLMSRIAGSGAMASVDLPAQQVVSELADRGIHDVVLAVVASPQSTVVGGATETVRELIAEWSDRGLMAREVAVDVASHSPQVDPILDDLADALEDLTPQTPVIPLYSSVTFDPREQAVMDADYWVDNLRHTVRFATAVQAALDDGYRVFGELAPHPLLVYPAEQTARGLEIPMVALAGMRREQALPHGLRGFVGDLHAAGSAVDFSVLYPSGELVDVPLPTWTRQSYLLSSASSAQQAQGGHTVSVHPLLGAHVRLAEEPERYIWQADVGTAAQPWIADHQVRHVAVYPGAAYCEMALSAARAVFGESAAVHDVSFEQLLTLGETTPISATATVKTPGSVDFVVETLSEGDSAKRATAILRNDGGADAPAAYDVAALRAEHPHLAAGDELRESFDERGVQYGPAFQGLAAAYGGDESVRSVLAEVALPRAIRAQQTSYIVHPALLDACFQSVIALPDVQEASKNALPLPKGVRSLQAYDSARKAHYCYTRVTRVDGNEVEADIDVLDEHGAVLLAVRGFRFGAGASEDEQRDQLLNNRLLAIEWQQQRLPEETPAGRRRWLLVSTGETVDPWAAELIDSLKLREGEVTPVQWRPDADHAAVLEVLREQLATGSFSGVLIVTAPADAAGPPGAALQGAVQVRHVVRISSELVDLPGESPRLYVLTRDAQTVVPGDVTNLEQAGLRGLVRVIGAEYPHLRVTHIDVDGHTDAQNVAGELVSGSEEDETAWRGGQWYRARLNLGPLGPDEWHTTSAAPGSEGVQFEVRTPGDLQSLGFVAFDRVPPGPGQIEVSVTATSINFADVLNVYGRYSSFEGRQELGVDFAGVVTAVGPGVTEHRIGDRVGGMTPHGAWKSFVVVDENLAATLPSEVPDQEAAAVPGAHVTAWYGLHELARISARDKVLIHSGTGGVGQAAIAIARAAGAEIYATAGSAERRDLLRSWGIEHVYDSRSTEFAELIRRDTDGYGVDIVLNSLTGAAQRAGLELLTFGGRFIEIGKLDIYGDTRLGLYPFRRNLAFYAVDLVLVAKTRPEVIHRTLSALYQQMADGVLPLPEISFSPLQDAAESIRVMGAAGHTGKLVLDLPKVGQVAAVIPPSHARSFRTDGAYIITGGLGGLGLFLAGKLAAAGCGQIILNGRSAPKPETLDIIDGIREHGTQVDVVLGDIAEPGTAQRLVAAATESRFPVRGVLHAAALVHDATLTNITDELIDRGDWRPKVHGAWNLHEATAEQPLDWFCSFSSIAALVGSPGQGAYAAANSWLDGFTHWRRAKGLPATVIAWGAWSEIGQGTHLANADAAILPDEGAYAFDVVLRHDRAYTAYAPMAGISWLADFVERSPFAQAFRASGQTQTETNKFLDELKALPREEWPTLLRRLVGEQVGLVLRRSIDPDRSLPDYGLDSLGNLEIRTRIQADTGVRIGPADVSTVRALATHLFDRLAEQEPESGTVGAAAPTS